MIGPVDHQTIDRVVERTSIELMTRDHLTPEHRVGSVIFFGTHWGCGLGMAVDIRIRVL